MVRSWLQSDGNVGTFRRGLYGDGGVPNGWPCVARRRSDTLTSHMPSSPERRRWRYYNDPVYRAKRGLTDHPQRVCGVCGTAYVSRSPKYCGESCRRVAFLESQRRWRSRWSKTPSGRAYIARKNRDYAKSPHGRVKRRIRERARKDRKAVSLGFKNHKLMKWHTDPAYRERRMFTVKSWLLTQRYRTRWPVLAKPEDGETFD